MWSAHNLGGNYWGTLIKPDKSPAPLLEQLCLAIAQLLPSLDTSSGTPELTPEKLAAFYREVGGNWDTLFLETKPAALAFIYRSLGCFHSLQPTANPFEIPSIPALLPHGFVRWQTIQILMCPDEHSRYLQNAVSQWDIPNPNGGFFPKIIPREAFPARPDPDMVSWHDNVSKQLEGDYQKSRTPRHSPPGSGMRYSHSSSKDPRTGEADYFSQGHGRRTPYRPRSKTESYEDAPTEARVPRRMSAENLSPGTPRFDPDYDLPAAGTRSAGAGIASSRASVPPPRSGRSSKSKAKERPSTASHRRSSSVHSVSSASDASSEGSILANRRGSVDERRYSRQRNLSPPSSSHVRRHSHDASTSRKHRRDASPYRSSRAPERNTYPTTPKREPDIYAPPRHTTSKSYSDGQTLPKYSKGAGVKFREYIFDDPRSVYPNPSLEPPGRVHPFPRYVDAMGGYYMPRHPLDPSPPDEKRRDSYGGGSSKERSGSGSSGTERSRSFANAGAGSKKWAGSARSMAGKRYIPVSLPGEYEPVPAGRRPPSYD